MLSWLFCTKESRLNFDLFKQTETQLHDDLQIILAQVQVEDCTAVAGTFFEGLLAIHSNLVSTLKAILDFNPAAKIGERFFLDKGTGIVVGETAKIGNDVKIHQGATLGELSVSKEKAKQKRHPTIEDDVIIYANASILGDNTTIGKETIIG